MTLEWEGVNAISLPDYRALRKQIDALVVWEPDSRGTVRVAREPVVTVAMPARNAAPFVATAVRSVLLQTGPALELIVVDDASDDCTAAIVEGIDDPRITLLRNERRRGIGYCHNRVLEHARAPIIVHVDADDLVLSGALASAHEAISASEDIGQTFAYGVEVDGEGHLSPEEWQRQWAVQAARPWSAAALRRELLVHGMVANPLRTYRRSVLRELGGFDEGLAWGVDYEMTLRVADRYAVRRIPRVLYCQRIHGGNTQQRLGLRALRFWWLRVRLYARHARRRRFLGFTRREGVLLLARGLLESVGAVRVLKGLLWPVRALWRPK